MNITLGIKVTFVQWLQSQITNAFFTGALLAFVAPLFSTMISERIRRAVGHEYDSKLEELRTSNTKVLDELRSARAEREAFRAMAMSTSRPRINGFGHSCFRLCFPTNHLAPSIRLR